EVLQELKREGVTIIYISHRLNELLLLGDHFTVLRSGRVVGEATRGNVSRQWIVERMSGRDVLRSPTPACSTSSRVIFQADGLSLGRSVAEDAAQAPLHDVSFRLYEGEILGIYGLLGSGRTELLETIAGLRRRAAGAV